MAKEPGFRLLICLLTLLATLMGIIMFDENLSVFGDNGEFIILGRALSTGMGMVYLSSPEPSESIKYPPGFPVLLAAVNYVFPGNISAMKMLVLICFLVSIPLMFGLFAGLSDRRTATLITVLCLISPSLLDFSHQVMSEIPFMVSVLGGLLLMERVLSRNRSIIWLTLILMASYYLRTAGLALVGSAVAFLVLQRRFKQAGLLLGGCFLLALPWTIYQSGRGNHYIQQLLNIDPYRSEAGTLTLWSFFERIGDNLFVYLFLSIPRVVLPYPFLWFNDTADYDAIHWILAVVLAGLIGCFFLVGPAVRKWSFPKVFLTFYLVMLLCWPSTWVDYRFLLPVVPLVFYVVMWSSTWIFSRLPVPFVLIRGMMVASISIVLLSNAVASVHVYNRKGVYPAGWKAYFEAGEWIRQNAEPDAIVSCRKGFLMHLISERKTIGYLWGSPSEVIGELERGRADLVILDELPFSSTPRYLAPAVDANRSRFRILHRIGDQDTYVLEFESVSEKEARELVFGARTMREAGDLRGARSKFERALMGWSSPKSYWIAYFNLGSTFQRQGDIKSALEIYEKVRNNLPNYANVYVNLGVLHYKEERYEDAAGSLERAVELGATDWKTQMSLSKAHVRTGNLKDAAEVLRSALASNQKVPELYLELAKLHYSQGEVAEAEEVLTHASRRMPENETIRGLLMGLDVPGRP